MSDFTISAQAHLSQPGLSGAKHTARLNEQAPSIRTIKAPSQKWLLQVINDSRSWLNLKQIATMGDIPISKCKPIIAQLVAKGVVVKKVQTSRQFPEGVTLYAKKSLALKEAEQLKNPSDFKCAKSFFQCHPELLEGKTEPTYSARPSPLQSLAMLARG